MNFYYGVGNMCGCRKCLGGWGRGFWVWLDYYIFGYVLFFVMFLYLYFVWIFKVNILLFKKKRLGIIIVIVFC